MVDIIRYLENIDDRMAGVYILIIMILQSPILTFPGYILMIYAGFKFGLLIGAMINYLGLFLSCIIGYRFGLWSSSDLSKSLNPRVKQFHNWVGSKGIKIVILLRIIPLIPNNVTSIGSGFSRISEKKHTVFSGFVILQSFFWSFLGAFMLRSVIGELHLELQAYHALVLMILIAVMLIVKYKYSSNPDSK